MNKSIENTPLIKEYRIDKIIECLRCIDINRFRRNSQRKCILELYPGKTEKSVFRGMVIPSLRDLGFIVGFAEFIRLSPNGKLLLESSKSDLYLYHRVQNATFCELDIKLFGFLDVIKNFPQERMKDITEGLENNVSAPNIRQRKERIIHWLSMLEQIGLLKKEKGILKIDLKYYSQALKDLKVKLKEVEHFKTQLFESYFEQSGSTAGIVDIVDLRESVALRFLKENCVLTEIQFDELLRNIPFSTKDYLIALGSSIGSGSLFLYKGQNYRTLAIRILKEKR